MKKLPPPPFTALEVFRLCNDGRQDTELRERMARVENEIMEADVAFRSAVEALQLHTLKASDFALTGIKDEEMVATYDKRLVGGIKGRRVYDALRVSAELCPLCGVGTVTTLDHHLPKAKYAALTVNPSNLIPACMDCNKNKTTRTPTCAEDEPLHPYFDDIDAEQWLKAVIVEGDSPQAEFYVDPPQSWSDILAARVRFHFHEFRLAKLYRLKAVTELGGIQHQMLTVLRSGGASALQQMLRTQAESRAQYDRNGWQAALYDALADSEWYCSGGGFAV